MNGRAPQLFATVTAFGALLAGLSSAASLYVGVRNAAANSENARIAALHAQSLAALTAQIGLLQRACDVRTPSRDTIHSLAAVDSQAPRVLPPEQVDALAASISERLTQLETPEPEPRDTDHIAAFDAASGVLEQALERRRWTEADATAMQDFTRRLHAEDAAELRRRLAVAVNDQQLELAFRETF